jgi:hypothetical protein
MTKCDKSAKNARHDRERRKRGLRKILPTALICIQEDMEKDLMKESIVTTESFPGMLRKIANDLFVDGEHDVQTPWIKAVCCMFTDIAEIEKVKNDLVNPKEIFFWFATYCEDTLPKDELTWNSSKLFTSENLVTTHEKISRCRTGCSS